MKRDKWNDVNIEIYYQQGHDYNVDRMIRGIRKTLDYCSANFSPYQHKQVRILEFPRYAQFAQAFPNTIPFSEGIGFILDVDQDTGIDMPFYVTAHEVAHQWWAHQVIGADVQGATVMSETMAQYSALMVMEHEYGRSNMQKFLKHELDRYLRGRAGETKAEQPLLYNDFQGYIHYQKGSLVMYALKDYLGEEVLNNALKGYVEKVAYQEPPYTTSLEFLAAIKAATPNSLQYLLTDLFETITLYNNEVKTSTSTKNADGSYEVSMDITTRKVRADGKGNETPIDLNDWIDVGVYGEDAKGENSLIYVQKHRFNKEETSLSIKVNEQPTKAAIDPLRILVDRDSDDNEREVGEK